MGTAVRTAKTSPASWDAFSDIEAFVDEVLTELAAMAGTRPTRPGPKPPLTGAALRKAVMAIWCVGFCGLQWRAIGQLCDIPFSTLYTLFAPGSVYGAGCSTGCAAPGGWLAATNPYPAPSSSTAPFRCPQADSCRVRDPAVGPELLRPWLRWREEDQRRQGSPRRRQVRHPAGDRRLASQRA
jgi:hypothetical protein